MGIDYHSMARTVHLSHNREGHRRRTDRRTVVDTLYVITAQVTLPVLEFWYIGKFDPNGRK